MFSRSAVSWNEQQTKNKLALVYVCSKICVFSSMRDTYFDDHVGALQISCAAVWALAMLHYIAEFVFEGQAYLLHACIVDKDDTENQQY